MQGFSTRIKNTLMRRLGQGEGSFSGPHKTWKEALKHATGYNAAEILEKVKHSTLQVKENSGLHVRDGVIFDTPQYSYPLFASLLRVACENRGILSLIDFGGSLGSKYFSFKTYYPDPIKINWQVVEQPHYVQCGMEFLLSSELSFYANIADVPILPDIILLSGVLQYLDRPYAHLDQIMDLGVPYLFIDRTLCNMNGTEDKILVEHVPRHIYSASYPCWFMSYTKLKAYLLEKYVMIDEFDGLEGKFSVSGFQMHSKGMFLRRKQN
jgi:putative methyltransferase (TIGR04325 family)